MASDSTDELIRFLDEWLRTNTPQFYSTLGAGLSEEELDNLERRLGGLKLPEDFRKFYAWKNGEPYFASLSPWHGWLMCDEVIVQEWEQRRNIENTVYTRVAGAESEDPFLWDVHWVPILDFGAGEAICVDTRGCFGGSPGQLIWSAQDEKWMTIHHSSIRNWLEAIVHKLERSSFASEEDIDSEEIVYERSDSLFADPGYPLAVAVTGEVYNTDSEQIR